MKFANHLPDHCGRSKTKEDREADIRRCVREIRLVHAGTSGGFSTENVAEVIVIMRRPSSGSFLRTLLGNLGSWFDVGEDDLESRHEWRVYVFRKEQDLMCCDGLLDTARRLKKNGYDVQAKVRCAQGLHRVTVGAPWLQSEPELPFEEYYGERMPVYEPMLSLVE